MKPNRDLFLVVMAGGSGTRFWPKSTAKKPKQLLSFGDEGQGSLLTQTLARFDGIIPPENRIIVTTRLLENAIHEQAPNVTVLAEPVGRNTAPCVYWAARVIAEQNPKAIMIVVPSDHSISELAKFRGTIATAAEWAQAHDDLITLGIRPCRAEIGYGYLKVGKETSGNVNTECRQVLSFVEKPDQAKAEEYLSSGQFLWNAGMFVWRTDVILRAFDELMPEMKRAWNVACGIGERAYPQMTAISIDYGIMERSKNVVTFPCDFGWDDLGSWIALENLAEHIAGAKQGGSVVTGGELLSIDSKHNIVDAPGKFVALLGIEDLIIVEQGGAILVCRKDRAQDIRLIVDQVKKIRPDLG